MELKDLKTLLAKGVVRDPYSGVGKLEGEGEEGVMYLTCERNREHFQDKTIIKSPATRLRVGQPARLRPDSATGASCVQSRLG